MTFDKLTLKAQEAAAQAQQIATEFGQQQVEVEHLLKALLSDNDGVPVAILKKLGVNLPQLQSEIDEALKK
ncbi:MAG: hypothetical protein GY954_00195, partial [Alteromonas sp.]|nr:hypothetical protein [Alteromonas sp.]